ncbi:MAG TPA: hypothetical protein VF820_05705 [Patescibacteria group bacterium]
MKQFECVKIPDGRIGRVREIKNGLVKVRVMRKTSNTHQFLFFKQSELKVVACPTGWMSPKGYASYLKITLAKMKKRLKK